MRNLSEGNKGRFVTFTVIVIIIVAILLIGVSVSLGMAKVKYKIENGSFFYDFEYTPVTIEQEATMQEKWNGNYYIQTATKEQYNAGKPVVIYKPTRRSIELYGRFFEIDKDGTITKYSEKNEITDTGKDRFFKIDDRKYLIVSRNITNPSRTLSTKDFLLVVLDKAGNAQIMNNEINEKILSQTNIDTPNFQFDIANEKLIFQDRTLDLKKIIGSTNQYKEKKRTTDTNTTEENKVEENKVEENTTKEENTENENESLTTVIQNNGGGSGTGEETVIQINTGNGSSNSGASSITQIAGAINQGSATTNSGTSSSSSSTTPHQTGNNSSTNQNKTYEKSVTLNRVTAGTTYIDVDYYILDPQGQYKAVYLLVEGDSEDQNIALDKGSTKYRITGLQTNKTYKLTLGSRSIGTKGQTVEKIEDVVEIRTTRNNSTLKVTKVTSKKVYFTLKLDPNCEISSGNIAIYAGSEVKQTLPIDTDSAYTSQGWKGSFDYPTGGEISLRVENTVSNGTEIPFNLYTKIKN